QYGRNELRRRGARRWPGELGRQFTHPLALLLWVTAALLLIVGSLVVAAAVVLIIVLNAVFAFVQEIEAERAVEALAEYIPQRAKVARDGSTREIDNAQLAELGQALPTSSHQITSGRAGLQRDAVQPDRIGLARGPGLNVTDEARTDRETPIVRRREMLSLPVALACGSAVLTGCGTTQQASSAATPTPTPSQEQAPEVPVTPPEDLMREHGVLKRVLLIYREGIRRINAGEQVPAQPLHAGAGIIRTFIEEYHEQLEERYVFPRLVKAGKLTDTVSVLVQQHQRGRVLTGRILDATAKPTPHQARRDLVANMAAFIRMYEPHEAREDTVVFPAMRDVIPSKEFAEMAETFEDEEHRRFGAAGFTGIVGQVADIEKTLGIYDLNQFTPRV
ncbi:hemerythrin domain-containing protein, partial [Nonomuraea sp. NPDC049784]|uniref:hemerythrin domain-containing protein n=1 Tax=Nonomuraea sp. NPDC049784 TaxID=3154361 RepID=UPI0033FF9F44